GSGRRALRLSTCGAASMRAAWLRVMPVAVNSSMPTRHTAELIQCHWCSVRNQKPRLRWAVTGSLRVGVAGTSAGGRGRQGSIAVENDSHRLTLAGPDG